MPTPQDNVALMHESFATLAREGVPPLEWLDPELELINFESFPISRHLHGWEGVAEWFAEMSEPFDDFRFELLDIVGADGDQVVATHRASGTSLTGGPPWALVWAALWTIRGGKVIRIQGFRDADEALAAAGLG